MEQHCVQRGVVHVAVSFPLYIECAQVRQCPFCTRLNQDCLIEDCPNGECLIEDCPNEDRLSEECPNEERLSEKRTNGECINEEGVT